jgi:hypothetical protein
VRWLRTGIGVALLRELALPYGFEDWWMTNYGTYTYMESSGTAIRLSVVALHSMINLISGATSRLSWVGYDAG